MMNKNRREYVSAIWLVVLSSAALLVPSRMVLPVKLSLASVLIAAAMLGTWAEMTGAGPKMSETGLLRLKVIGVVLALMVGAALGVWLHKIR